ncbi:hypothetical protein ACOMHN_009928 [Nucella lapillus]
MTINKDVTKGPVVFPFGRFQLANFMVAQSQQHQFECD